MQKFSCSLLQETRKNFKVTSTATIPSNDTHQNSPDMDDDESSSHDEIKILKKIQDGNFPTYLACFSNDEMKYALKVFKYKDNKMSQEYIKEAKFNSLSHPNFLKILRLVDKQRFIFEKEDYLASFLITELPICDFIDIVRTAPFLADEKLARTYFHQLVEAVEYLHSKGFSHGNLSDLNVILGQDLQLKIGTSQEVPQDNAENNYQPPEAKIGKLVDQFKADIYSLGIHLFVFKTGFVPCNENVLVHGYNLYDLMHNDPSSFWIVYNNLTLNICTFSPEFKELFISMISKDPAKRPSISDIKRSKWFKRSTYSSDEFETIIKDILP